MARSIESSPHAGEPPGTLIVAGGRGVEVACRDACLVEEIRIRAPGVCRLASVCSGAFPLATAGLLDDRRAATYWQRGPDFRERFPKVRLEFEPIFIRDGTIWTSAGIDLCLALVEEDLGHAAALVLARQLVVFLKRPGDQAQFSAPLERQTTSGPFAACTDGWRAICTGPRCAHRDHPVTDSDDIRSAIRFDPVADSGASDRLGVRP